MVDGKRNKKASQVSGGGKVLVVDDSAVQLRNLSRLLGEAGYGYVLAKSGEEAAMRLREGDIELILLDVLLPDGSGFDWCRRWAEEAETGRVAVLFMTGLDDVESKLAGFAAGGVDFITKPFEEAELLARVKTHLEMLRLREQLRGEVEAKDRALVELDAFAHTVAHDLKSPLAGVIGFAELIRDEVSRGKPVDLPELCEDLLEATRQGLRIVDETLLLASVRGEPVQPEAVNMEACLERSLKNLQWMMKQQGVEVVRKTPLPVVAGRDSWLAQVWMNLISNAARHGGRPPRVEIWAEGEAGRVVFHVEDNGRGVDAAEREQLFQEYGRLATARSGGNGLGLSIVRRIVERLGGEVGVGEGRHGGADFRFTMPLVCS